MNILTTTDGADPNYLACVIECASPTPHPNADRLDIINVFGNDIVVGRGLYTKGDKLVYFPIECSIAIKFLSWANLLSKSELNRDQTTTSYFSTSGRVKAISLRGIPSQGFLFKVSELAKYYEISETSFNIGDSFDTVSGDILVKKYIKPTPSKGSGSSIKAIKIPKWVDKIIAVFPKPIRKRIHGMINLWYGRKLDVGVKSLIMDGEFKFHYKTEQLGRNIFILNPHDCITITEKLHGASGIYSNIKCKRPFSLLRYICNKLGCNIPETVYKFVYSSRQIIKTRRDGKYTGDIWGIIASELDGVIPNNIRLYGELVGWSSPDKHIQKNYDYSVPMGECEFRVYRVVENVDGESIEFGWDELVDICDRIGVKTVPLHYTGIASELFDIPIDDNWREEFLSKLKETYLDKPCKFCTTGAVQEGIVLRIENSPKKTAFKFKSPKFNILEGALRDNNSDDIEEDN